MIPNQVFQDNSEKGFGPGPDFRKPTITYAQAMEVMRVLNNLGIYGDIYVNREGLGADYVEVDPTSTEELIYVLFYGGQYHELAEMAVWLDKSPKLQVIRRLFATLNMYDASVLNIPVVSKAVEEALKKLF